MAEGGEYSRDDYIARPGGSATVCYDSVWFCAYTQGQHGACLPFVYAGSCCRARAGSHIQKFNTKRARVWEFHEIRFNNTYIFVGVVLLQKNEAQAYRTGTRCAALN